MVICVSHRLCYNMSYWKSRTGCNIMRKASIFSHQLEVLIFDRKIVTMQQMIRALGGTTRMTVFRKLRSFDYRSSYSHWGKYYTLVELAEFNEYGIWSWKGVHFSRYGTLMETLESLVCSAEAGYYSDELREVVQVRTKDALLELWHQGKILRESVWNRYLYLSPRDYEDQISRRRLLETQQREQSQDAQDSILPEERLREEFLKFLSSLNEKQRRWYVALESLKMGRGGDRRMAELTGMDVKTIARGREELRRHDVTPERVRETGAGRHRMEKKTK